jgi:hypothetical protein
MELFVFSFAALGLAFLGMAVGAMLGRASLRRGCGYLDGADCEACTRPCPHRPDGARS